MGLPEVWGGVQLRFTWYETARPVPLRLTMSMVPVDELLAMVNTPVAAPADAGSNATSSVTPTPGFSVTGIVAPETLNPAPVNVTELTVTGKVPEEYSRML